MRKTAYIIELSEKEKKYVELLLSLDVMRIDSLDEASQLYCYKIRHGLREKLFSAEAKDERHKV